MAPDMLSEAECSRYTHAATATDSMVHTDLSKGSQGGGILLASRQTGAGGEKPTGLAAVEIKILIGFIIALSLLLAAGGYTYRASAQFARTAEWIAHTLEVRASLASLYGSLAGAEVALRDYVLTVHPRQREEYELLVGDVRQRLGDLERLTTDNPEQQHNLDALRPVVAARLAAMSSALTAFADYGLPAARAVIGSERSTNSTQDVRELTDRMIAVEAGLLAERQTQAATVRRTTLVSLLVTLAVASGLLVALFRAIHREMLARSEAEQALRTSEHYNRSIVDSSPDFIGVLTLDGRITQMTPQSHRLLGIDDITSLADSDWLSLWTGTDRAAAQAAVEAARRGSDGRFQSSSAKATGMPKWWDVIVMPIFGASGEPERLLAVARDISEVKRTESDLREANRFLDSLIDNLPVIVAVKDAKTLRIERHNRAFAQLLDRPSEQLLGRTADELFNTDEAMLITAKDREALAEGRLVDIPEQVIETSHLGARTFHTMKVPIGGEDGKPQFLLEIAVDITGHKLAEQAIHALNSALEAKAAQLQATNQELESFSYSVSHDLRAPLRAVDGFALMVEEDYSDRLDAEGRRYLSVIRANSKRMGALIDDLLTFSRLGRLPVATQTIDVEALVREVVDEALNGHQGPPVTIRVAALPTAYGDRGLLRQVWANLLANAIKYSSKAAVPCIVVSGELTATESCYAVRDNGVGFDMQYVSKLFGVFQRLHREDEFSGTGVGLAIVQRVVSRHGGRVWAEGKIGAGAVFSFALPRGEV
jgi:PAS domain S-box-containing protein